MSRYWFRAKKYGYGWKPATWQAWLVLGLYVAGTVYVVFGIREDMSRTEMVWDVLVPCGLLTLLLVAISWRTGEPTRWQWGGKQDKEKKNIERRM